MSSYDGFVGSTYSGQAITFDAERAINLYLEYGTPGTTPKSAKWLSRTPGRKIWKDLRGAPWFETQIRGITAGDQFLFVAGLQTFYQIDAAGNVTIKGNFQPGTTPVRMFQNGYQLFLVSNNLGYLHDGITLRQVVNAAMGTYIDGYFVAQQPLSNQFNISDLAPPTGVGGLLWDPLEFATKQGGADRLVATFADHEELWLIGKKTTEVWYNSGNALFPFQRYPAAFIEQGCVAPWSVAKLDNSLFWLGGDDRGVGIVWRLQGYLPVRVSNHAVEAAIQGYRNAGLTITDAIAYAYQENGHSFYDLNFPTANATWVYDCATNQWHERGAWNLKRGAYQMDLAQYHADMFDLHIVGGQQSGILYSQSESYFDDAGNPLRWFRSAPHINTELRYNFFQRLQLEMMVGGNNPGIPDPFRNAGNSPSILMRFSNDGGFTWSDQEYVASAAALGNYRYRVQWRQLGRARDRVFQVYGSDPVQIAIIDADLDVLPEKPSGWPPRPPLG